MDFSETVTADGDVRGDLRTGSGAAVTGEDAEVRNRHRFACWHCLQASLIFATGGASLVRARINGIQVVGWSGHVDGDSVTVVAHSAA